MQNQGKEKPVSDQVVLHFDLQRSPKPPKSPNLIDPASGDDNPQPPTPSAKPRSILRAPSFSKPKSRFIEMNYPITSRPISTPEDPEPNKPNTGDSDEESEDEGFKEEEMPEKYRRRKRRVGRRAIVESVLFVFIMASLVSTLTVKPFKKKIWWGLKPWKWCLMVLQVFCGRLVAGWLVSVLVFVIERHFMLREKVLYFMYGLRRSVQNCLWLALVLLSWSLMFKSEMENSSPSHRLLLKRVSRALLAVLIAAVIWLVKILLVKVLASSFHVATFFDRMQESVFHQYVLNALSGPAQDEISPPTATRSKRETLKRMATMATASSKLSQSKRVGSRRIDKEKLRRLSRSRASALNVKRLVGLVSKSGLSGLSTLSTTMDQTMSDRETESEIRSEWEARNTAQRIFKNVAGEGKKYIEESDLSRFLDKEEVQTILPLFEGAMETGKIRKSAFKNWVVRAYIERKALAHSLNDTKTAVQQLHKLASGVVIIIIIVVSVLVMGLATSKVILVVTSQLLLVVFIFGNTCKTIFESIIFVFVMHPFDVGDRCVIDGVQMIVEEMNILSTVFLRYDNEKIFYPNSVLLTKPVSNFNRSPEMGDTVEFSIDVSTSESSVVALKKSIQTYIESKPKHWQPQHSVVVKEIENVNKMKMALYVLHTMNYQNFPERNNRRSDLVFELKKIFENLSIEYHLLPQEVRLSHVSMANGRMAV